MTGENLLPWREERYDRLKINSLLLVCTACLIGALIAGFCRFFLMRELHGLQGQEHELAQEVSVLKTQYQEKTKREDRVKQLKEQLGVFNQVAHERGSLLRLLSGIEMALPGGLFLKTLDYHGNIFELSGEAQEAYSLRFFLENLQTLGSVHPAVIKTLTVNPIDGKHLFLLTGMLVTP